MTVEPKFIIRQDFVYRLQEDVMNLTEQHRNWWNAHSIDPYAVDYDGKAHYVVAVLGRSAIFYADDEDEFGFGAFDRSRNRLLTYGLAGDLQDAVSIVRQNYKADEPK